MHDKKCSTTELYPQPPSYSFIYICTVCGRQSSNLGIAPQDTVHVVLRQALSVNLELYNVAKAGQQAPEISMSSTSIHWDYKQVFFSFC